MTIIAKHTEITVRVASEPGALEKSLKIALSACGDILATRSYWDGSNAILMLVADHPDKVCRAFQAAAYRLTTTPIILVGPLDSPASSALYGAALAAARIHVLYAYSHQTEDGHFFQVFKTSDDDRALRALQLKTAVLQTMVDNAAPPAMAVHASDFAPAT